MHFALATTLLAVAASAAAQTIHNVTVGEGGLLKFNPQNITAAVGDKVSFEFRAKNHTVTQSTFAQPCVPATINGSAGVDSGFMFIPNNTNLQPGEFPTWTITINTDGPLWFHCAQTNGKNHCQAGMVFSINETPEKTFDSFLATAMSFDPASLTSGSSNATTDPAAASGAASASGATASGTSGAANTGSSPSSAAGAPSPSDSATAEASNQKVTSGASPVVVSRGAAGLLAALSIGAMFI